MKKIGKRQNWYFTFGSGQALDDLLSRLEDLGKVE